MLQESARSRYELPGLPSCLRSEKAHVIQFNLYQLDFTISRFGQSCDDVCHHYYYYFVLDLESIVVENACEVVIVSCIFEFIKCLVVK